MNNINRWLSFNTKKRNFTMDKNIFINKLNFALKENTSIVLSEKQQEQMFLLAERLVEVNKVMNLTAITDEDGIILRHLVDSLLVSEYFATNSTIIDVGCGAGFPSLPLAIARPDLQITALDSTEKRIRYVDETAKMLGLSNVEAATARAEEFATLPNKREKYDYATARAVASLPILCELTIPFIKVGGTDNLISGKIPARDLDEINAICRRGVTIFHNLTNFGDYTINNPIVTP